MADTEPMQVDAVTASVRHSVWLNDISNLHLPPFVPPPLTTPRSQPSRPLLLSIDSV